MKRAMRSGAFYFFVWFLLLEIVSRTVIVNHAFLSVHHEMDHVGYVLAQRATTPRVLYLGSSQTQANVATREISLILGLPLGVVVNSSVAAAGPREMLHIYLGNEAVFSSAEVVYVNVDLWMFNKHIHMEERQGPATWRRTASLQDRLNYNAGFGTKADWVLGWFVATWDQRDTWRSALRSWLRNPWTHRVTPVYDCFGRPVRGFLDDINRCQMIEKKAPGVVSSHLQNYELSFAALDALGELLDMIRANGALPVLLRLPAAQAYTDVLESEYPSYDFVWREISTRFPETELVDLSQLKFGDEDWWDVYHLSLSGALKLAVPLADDLGMRLQLPQPPE